MTNMLHNCYLRSGAKGMRNSLKSLWSSLIRDGYRLRINIAGKSPLKLKAIGKAAEKKLSYYLRFLDDTMDVEAMSDASATEVTDQHEETYDLDATSDSEEMVQEQLCAIPASASPPPPCTRVSGPQKRKAPASSVL